MMKSGFQQVTLHFREYSFLFRRPKGKLFRLIKKQGGGVRYFKKEVDI